jgi:hypothetical protein
MLWFRNFLSYFKEKPLVLGRWNLKYKHMDYYENKEYPH